MRRVAVLTGFVLALSASTALAGPPQKATGGVQFINVSDNVVKVGFNAHASLKGQVEVRAHTQDGDLVQRWHGSVDCYSQSGSTATFSGEVTQLMLGTNTNEGMFFKLTAMDGGEGKNAAPDGFAMQRHDTPQACDTPLVTNSNFGGNIQVHG